MLKRDGLIRYHSVSGIVHGGTILAWDFRNTAVLVKKATGTRFAIDTTLVDAAVPPPIFPLSVWLASWPPNVPDLPAAPEKKA